MGQACRAWRVVIFGISPQMAVTKSPAGHVFCCSTWPALGRSGDHGSIRNHWSMGFLGTRLSLESDCPDSNPYTITHQLCDLGTSLPLSGDVGPVECGQLESLFSQRLDLFFCEP